ncbi:MAG: hypothetical protein COX07_06750 [Bacteroidetes bacterium CG23_combo_of_CG06-09_8_20_14_all_32_9]|nr:MAG: hypothetical protein COX07_06750 [Bacteroidetes bacterium CG23_combo_of_CG06-09_8_20_14_all_32_9]
MIFLYPTFLFFLGLIAIPVIIHFFHFRRYKTVYFSSLKFLFNVAKETRSRNRLKHLLVLLARIFTIICLVFAFAQPFIPATNRLAKTKSETIVIYIDNSFSMNADGTNGNLLEEAKSKVPEIISSYPPSTNFALITNDLEPKHQHILNRDQLTDYISAVRSSPRTVKFSDIIIRAMQISNSGNEKSSPISFCFLSDFQKYFIDMESVPSDTTISFMLFPSISLPAKNLSIDSCWFDYPEHNLNQQEKLQVKIVNHSTESYQNIPVKLFINDSVKTMGSFSIAGSTSETINLAYTNISKGTIRGKIELTDYPVTYDNSYFFNYDVTDKIRILAINGNIQSQYFKQLFKNDSIFAFNEMSEKNINFQFFSSNQVIILNALSNISSGLQQELNTFTSKGGSIVFIPSNTDNANNYSMFLSSFGITIGDSTKGQTASINDKSPFFKNVFQKIDDNPQLPFINKNFNIKASVKNRFDELLLSRSGNPLLLYSEQNKGKIYVFAFPFDEKSTNFTVHPLFVPVFYRICMLSKTTSDICYIISPDVSVVVSNFVNQTDDIIELKNRISGESFIPSQTKGNSEITLFPGNQLFNDGLYDILFNGNAFSSVSFNYNRKESLTDYYSPDDLKNLLSDKGFKVSLFSGNNNEILSAQLKLTGHGKPLWKYFILLALLFLASEIALVRLLKN